MANEIGWAADEWTAMLAERRMLPGQYLAPSVESVAWSAREAVATAEDRGHPEEWRYDGRGLVGGVFAAMYDSAAERIDVGPAWARAAVSALADMPEMDEARRVTCGDPDMAAIATRSMVESITTRLPEIAQALRDAGLDPVTGQPTDPDADAEDLDLPGAVAAIGQGVRGMARAVSDAVSSVAEARAALGGVLPGLGDAPPRSEQESPARLALVARLGSDSRLRRILHVAGRMQRISDRVRRQRTDEIHEEVVDVERGAEIGRILPAELAGLRRGRMARLLVLKGIADRSLLQYRMTGSELLGRGPIVVLLDVSDSMDRHAGSMRRIDWAAAVGIASIRSAVMQRRKVTIATFNHSVQRSWAIASGDSSAARAAVLEIASIGCSGGTSFDGPIGWSLDAGAEQDRADLILVTDGEARLSAHVAARLAKSKIAGLRVWAVLAGEGDTSTLAEFTDGIASVHGDESAETIGALGAV